MGWRRLSVSLDGFGAQVEELFHLVGDLAVAHLDMAAAVGVDIDAHGLSHTDGIGQLHKHLVGHAGSHHVLGDIAGGIGCRAVHLDWVLAREGTAAVGALASVGVDDDLAARETGVAVRAADDELTRGVDVVLMPLMSSSLKSLRAPLSPQLSP
jgi:hypothetical protein